MTACPPVQQSLVATRRGAVGGLPSLALWTGAQREGSRMAPGERRRPSGRSDRPRGGPWSSCACHAARREGAEKRSSTGAVRGRRCLITLMPERGGYGQMGTGMNVQIIYDIA